MKSQKLYLTDYNLLIVQDLWQAPYQVLLIILLKEFMKINVNSDIMITNLKLMKLNAKIATAFSNVQTLKLI